MEKTLQEILEKIDKLPTRADLEREVENLAVMSQNQFREIGRRFDAMDGRFDTIDVHLEDTESRDVILDSKIDTLVLRTERVENISVLHEERIKKLEE